MYLVSNTNTELLPVWGCPTTDLVVHDVVNATKLPTEKMAAPGTRARDNGGFLAGGMFIHPENQLQQWAQKDQVCGGLDVHALP